MRREFLFSHNPMSPFIETDFHENKEKIKGSIISRYPRGQALLSLDSADNTELLFCGRYACVVKLFCGKIGGRPERSIRMLRPWNEHDGNGRGEHPTLLRQAMLRYEVQAANKKRPMFK